MARKPRILVVDSNLHSLSRIYLSLLHKNYKVEATDNAAEIFARTERFKPMLIVLSASTSNVGEEIYSQLAKQRIWVILLQHKPEEPPLPLRKVELLPEPVDLHALDEKIREVLNLVEL